MASPPGRLRRILAEIEARHAEVGVAAIEELRSIL